MKNWLRATALLLGLTYLAASVQSAEPTQPAEMKSFVLGLLYKGSAWKPATTEEARQLQSAHRANIDRLVNSGALAVAGPVDSNDDLRGIFIFNVDTVEKAQALIATDPAVRANQLRYQLYIWYGPVAIETATSRSRPSAPDK